LTLTANHIILNNPWDQLSCDSEYTAGKLSVYYRNKKVEQ